MPVIKKANTTIGIPGTFSAVCSQMTPVTTCKVSLRKSTRAFLRGGRCGDRRQPGDGRRENLSRVLDTIYGVIDKFNIRPRAACWRTSPPRLKRSVVATRRADFPEYLRQRKRAERVCVELAMLDEARAVGAEFNRIAGKTASTSKPDKALRCPLALLRRRPGDDGSA